MASFSTKTWVDRISEYPTRRTLTKENGTSEIVTVSRSEGTISKEGDAFSAANMNNLETRINSAITSVNTDITALKKSVSDGKTLVAKAITDGGTTTAADAEFATMASNIGIMAEAKYWAGANDADNRPNTASVNYKTGYKAGALEGSADMSIAMTSGTINGISSIYSGIIIHAVNGPIKITGLHNGAWETISNPLPAGTYNSLGMNYFSRISVANLTDDAYATFTYS